MGRALLAAATAAAVGISAAFSVPAPGAAVRATAAVGIRGVMMNAAAAGGGSARGAPSKEELEVISSLEKDGAFEVGPGPRGTFYSEVGMRKALGGVEGAHLAAERRMIEQDKEEEARQRMRRDIEEAATVNEPSGGASAGSVINSAVGEGGKVKRLPLPLYDVNSLGLRGNWEELGGNFLLRPPPGVEPVALIHFLGGAFVGAAPHLTYNYLLSGLAEGGFLVVATPYPLGFDYLEVCDGILDRFEKAALPLAEEYGALPVVGVGHSCGALLQLLITCLFPDTPRAANCLISFNNKPVSDAVPAFEEIVLPLAQTLLSEGTGLGVLGGAFVNARHRIDEAVGKFAKSRLSPALLEGEILPLVRQTLEMLDQIPPLLESIRDGTREFAPNPEQTKEVTRKMYRARRTLVIKFENDSLDESEEIKSIIQEGKTLLRMRRPMIDMDLRLEVLKGSHITPLTQNIFLDTPFDRVDPLLGVRTRMRSNFLKTVNSVGRLITEWLEEGLVRGPIG